MIGGGRLDSYVPGGVNATRYKFRKFFYQAAALSQRKKLKVVCRLKSAYKMMLLLVWLLPSSVPNAVFCSERRLHWPGAFSEDLIEGQTLLQPVESAQLLRG